MVDHLPHAGRAAQPHPRQHALIAHQEAYKILALDRLDAAARRQTGKAFAELAAADRLAFLAAHDKAALAPVPLAPDAPKGSLFEPVISVADVGYHKLKELVLVLFYASEAGLTSDLSYEHVPGKWQPSIKVTPETRPAAAFGIF